MITCSLLPIVMAGIVTESQPMADLIVTDGRVWTVDSQRPEAEAVAIRGDRIVAVGSSQDIAAWQGPRTRVIDARGRRVLPGFNDAHVHFISGGRQLDSVDLRDCASPNELARRIADHAEKLPEGQWIVGGDWDEQRWSPPALPTKALIDPFTARHPVLLSRTDGHIALANSLALQMAGVTRATQDPVGGAIVRTTDGEPTGVLKDAAIQLVQKVIPPLSPDERRRAALRALDHAARLGVTSVQDMCCSYADIATYAQLAEEGALTTRVYAIPMETRWADFAQIGIRRAFGTPLLRLGALKGFADGSLGASTAYFFEPLLDDPSNRGLLADEMQPLEGIRERMTRADAAGLQLCIHAIGDHAVSIVLDLMHDVQQANGPRDRRLRIEHSQHVAPKDFQRYKDLDVIASVQPYHAIDDGRWAESRIGAQRARTTYAFRTFLDHGVRLAFGTDWNVAPLNPLTTIYAAVTRATLDGRHPDGWVPEQKITVAEAVQAYTLGSAYAEFQEHEKGSLTPGKLADIVILDQDIFSIAPQQIRDVQVDMTIMGGKVVWE